MPLQVLPQYAVGFGVSLQIRQRLAFVEKCVRSAAILRLRPVEEGHSFRIMMGIEGGASLLPGGARLRLPGYRQSAQQTHDRPNHRHTWADYTRAAVPPVALASP